MNNITGHSFLTKLGKKRLKPGGIRATRFLMKHVSFNKDNKVLEVGCGQGLTSIELLKKYKFLKIVAVDIDLDAIRLAKKNALKAKVSDRIEFIHADGTKLDFINDSFDLIICESMLTMLTLDKKEQAVKGFYRLLKKGGKLLTQDIMIDSKNEEIVNQIITDLANETFTPMLPLTLSNWHNVFASHGFLEQERLVGRIIQLNPIGMIIDEGFFSMIKIYKNALNKENKERFSKLIKVFRKYQSNLRFIANISYKL